MLLNRSYRAILPEFKQIAIGSYSGHVWINNLFAAYSTSTYHDKPLCIHLHKLFL